MSSAVAAPERRSRAPEHSGEEWLRCPGERAALVLCVISNFVVLGAAIAIVLAGTAWLGTHPVLARHVDWIRAIVIAAILALPTTALVRQISFAATRGGAVRLSERQFPELYAQFLAASRKLGLEKVPELYMSRDVEGRVAIAHAIWRGRAVVVVNAEFVDEDWIEGLDWLTFAVAGALGAIRLGHTRWWVELLTVYARRIPGLRTPLLVKWTRSRDRCAAFVVPRGIRGLIVEAVGNHALPAVDVPAFVDQTERAQSFWERIATLYRKAPLLLTRARALYDEGFFDRARDRAWAGPRQLS